jgi:hypothetical protein
MPDKWAQYAQPAPAAPSGDKWAQYAQQAAPQATSAPTSPPQPGPVQPGNPLTSGHFIDTLRANYDDATRRLTPQEVQQQGTPATMLRSLGTGMAKFLLGPVIHPVDTAKGMASTLSSAASFDPASAVQQMRGQVQDINQNGLKQVLPDLAGQAAGSVLAGHVLAGLPAAGQNAATIASHPIDTLTSPLRSGLDEPILGQNVTPRQRYQSAQRLGVQLDAADATNNGALKMVKKVNEHSLLGGSTYEKAKASNSAALQGSTNDMLTSMYDGDREGGGAAIQTALRQNQQGLQQGATEGFKALPHDLPIPGSEAVGKEAQAIQGEVAPYQERYPSMVPRQTMSIVSDVANLAPRPLPEGVQGPVATPRPTNFGELQQLRSDLLESGRTNPDLVKNQSGGWLKRLSGAADQALTSGSEALTPEEQATFRDANSKWADMKSTYDDPSSALYHAVRSNAPSKLYNGEGLGTKTPEVARDLLTRLGQTGDALQPPAVGALRRGTVESALKTTNDGSPNLKTFGTQLNRIPADYRAELFTPDQNAKLNDVATTSNLLGQDANPSGSAKLGQKAVEAGSLLAGLAHPLSAVAPALQYPLAKLLNSPGITDYLMTTPHRPLTAIGRGVVPLPLVRTQQPGS